ncbi:MAG: tyrosine recombinase XerC [Oscillospiraceae bacterium]|nr:tyrosine recombinase XerC [Oscillospiraceae bacterium]
MEKLSFLTQCPPILKKFLGYLITIKGKSENTAGEYYFDLRTFFRYIKKVKDIDSRDVVVEKINIQDVGMDLIKSITLDDIYEYLNYTLGERKNNAATRARKVSSLRSFFKYLTAKINLLEIDPTKNLDTPKLKSSLPKFLTLDQSIKLLESVSGDYRERDYCILVLFLNCGMRLSELVGINFSDINNDNLLKITGKGNKERMVYLNKSCILAIDAYKKVRPIDGIKDKDALFVSKFKKRISTKTVQHIVYKYLDAIGIRRQGYSAHKLRHTAATLMYHYGGVDIRVLKEVLGHKSIDTTEIYTHVSNKQIENAFLKNPLSNLSVGLKDKSAIYSN